jgi:hypothetical protein
LRWYAWVVRFGTSRLIINAVALVLLPVLCAAAELTIAPANSSINLPTNDHGIAAQRYLNEKLSLWQKRLKLEAWNVTVIASERDDLRAGTLGNIHWDLEKKTAVIRVLDPGGYQMSSDAVLRDLEFTVVHELIHLEFCASTRADQASRADEETSVNNIAEALLQLDRKD